ncbi:MAG: hypothetical protein LBL83_00595 [Clostridiales bacterium]|jgi:hypothetical protein|nr:hypothetical protein [Clostridiales bacterium]
MGAVIAQKAKNGANDRQKGATRPRGRIFERKAVDRLAACEHIPATAKKRYIHVSHHLSPVISGFYAVISSFYAGIHFHARTVCWRAFESSINASQ